MRNFISLWLEFPNPPVFLSDQYRSIGEYFYPEVITQDGSLWVKMNIDYNTSNYVGIPQKEFFIQNNGWQGLMYCFHRETGDFDPDFKSMRKIIDYKEIGSHCILVDCVSPEAWFEIDKKLYLLRKLGEYHYSLSIDKATPS